MKYFALIALLLIIQTQTADVTDCGSAAPAVDITIKWNSSKTGTGSGTVITTMDLLNTCLGELVATSGGDSVNSITIDLNGQDIAAQTVSVNFGTLGAVEATFDLIITDSQTLVGINTAKAWTLFLDNIHTNKAKIASKTFQFAVIIASSSDNLTSAQATKVRDFIADVTTLSTSTFSGVCQAITDAASLTSCLTQNDKTACSDIYEVIDISAATHTSGELDTCLTQANVANGQLKTLNVNLSSQSLSAAYDFATNLSNVKTQVVSLTVDFSGNTIEAIPDITGFTALTTASINLANNNLDATKVGTLLSAIENVTLPTNTALTVTLLSATATNQNILTDYDVLNASLEAQKTANLLTYNLIKADGTTVCNADNDKTGTPNGNWATTLGTACDQTMSLSLTIDNATPLACTGETVVLTLNADWVNGGAQADLNAEVPVWTYTKAGSGTAIDAATMESLDSTKRVNTLTVGGLTVAEVYTVTVTVTISSTDYTATATITPATCVPSGDIVVAGGDSDSAVEICEEITLSVPTLANDPNSLDQSTLTWTWTILPAPLTAPASTSSSSLVLAKDTLTAQEYTVTASITETTMVINNGSQFKFTPVACNDVTPPAGDDDDDDDDSQSVLRVSALLLVLLAYIL